MISPCDVTWRGVMVFFV